MKIHVLTLFPGLFQSFLSETLVKRAIEKKIVSVAVHDLRAFTTDRHRTCDDKPFGGGPGMLLKPEPIFKAVGKIFGRKKPRGARVIYLSPRGRRLDQNRVETLAKSKAILLLCGRYEGVDQRVIDRVVTDEISIGDYVLAGGEIPAMVLMEAVTRLQKGAMGRETSKEFESFATNLLEYPQYTRPAVYRGLKVPAVLLSGNHQAIEDWRKSEALKLTRRRRPDLLKIRERGKKRCIH